MRRWIMHVDMDAFFASVEQREHPEWRGRPVIVGGLSSRGVVSTASYEARAFGVHSAMPITRARTLCPQGIFAKPHFELYKSISEEIHGIMLHYAPAIEPISLDEAFMDISGMGIHFRTVGDVGRAIKREILEQTGLVASAGIAPNKFLAKMASDMDKPDGLCVIPYGREAEILAPLPIRRLWGVGRVTEEKLLALGYRTIGDIQRADTELLARAVGNQAGVLHALSLGIDDRPIVASRQVKSVGDEMTHEKDLRDMASIRRKLAVHSDIVARRLRKKKLAARTVSVKLRFSSFRTVMRSVSFEEATNLAEDIEAAALGLLAKISINEGVRLTGVTASNIAPEVETMSLFEDKRTALAKVARAMDEIQEKYGDTALRKGFYMEEERKEE